MPSLRRAFGHDECLDDARVGGVEQARDDGVAEQPDGAPSSTARSTSLTGEAR